MTKRYSTLEAKLQEVECILNEALLGGPDDSLSKDIEQKLVFIGKLLSAEVASHPSKPHHLQHISQRLAVVEKAFHEWDAFRTFSFEDFDNHSTCSCTESCFNDDGEALDDTEMIVFEDPEKLFPHFIGEKAMVEFHGSGFDHLASFVYEDAEDFFEDFAGDKELVEFDGGLLQDNELEREERRRDTAFGKKCCALAGGVVLGMIFMGFIMVNFSGCFHFVEQTSFTIPT